MLWPVCAGAVFLRSPRKQGPSSIISGLGFSRARCDQAEARLWLPLEETAHYPIEQLNSSLNND